VKTEPSSLRTARCPVCGKRARLRKDGTLGAHGEVAEFAGIEFIVHCSGTGRQA
jgi:phage/plasmid primase-like uncharacterized protein